MSKFTQYQAFVSIVENGSLSKAAKELLTTPSSISKQLSKLEADLGTQLIDRSTHALTITNLGNDFYHRCKEILHGVRDAEMLVKNERAEPNGKLALSMSPALLKTPFLALLESFTDQYPEIKFDLDLSGNNIDLIDSSIDFAFRIGELKDSRLTAIPLAKLQLCICASPSYLKKHANKQGKLSFDKIMSGQHIIVPTFTNTTNLTKLLNFTEDTSRDLRHFHSTESEVAFDEMACAGLGVSVTIDISVLEDIKQGRLVRLFPSKRFPALDLHLIYHRRNYMPENMRIFKDFVKDNFPGMIQTMQKG